MQKVALRVQEKSMINVVPRYQDEARRVEVPRIQEEAKTVISLRIQEELMSSCSKVEEVTQKIQQGQGSLNIEK